MLCNWHKIALMNVLSACNYLNRLVLSNIYLSDKQMVRIRVTLHRNYLAHNNVRNIFTLLLKALYF